MGEVRQVDYDCVIVGGGIAGLSAALYAEKAGLRVVIFETQEGPIDKACGEGLLPPAVSLLRELITAVPGYPLDGIEYRTPLGRATSWFVGTKGLGARRSRLHEKLWQAVIEKNIPMVNASVHTIAREDDHVRVGSYLCRYVFLCDGLRSRLRKKLGFEVTRKLAPRFGIRQHFKVRAGSFRKVTVYWGKDFELYLTPIGPEEVGIACLSREAKALLPTIRQFPELHRQLGMQTSVVRGAGPFEHKVNKTYSERVFLVGDCAGYLDPLTGEGLHLAVASAKLAVACVVKNAPLSYHRKWLSLTRRYRWLTFPLLCLTRHPFGRNVMYAALKFGPWILSMAIRFLLAGFAISSAEPKSAKTPENRLVKEPHSL